MSRFNRFIEFLETLFFLGFVLLIVFSIGLAGCASARPIITENERYGGQSGYYVPYCSQVPAGSVYSSVCYPDPIYPDRPDVCERRFGKICNQGKHTP